MAQDEQATSPAINTPADSYAAATQTLRTTARWLITAAAGVGGVLVAGLGLKGFGSLNFTDWPRLVVAVASIVAALVAVGYMITRASRILTDEWITLAQLSLDDFQEKIRESETLRGLSDELLVYREELYGDVAEDIAGLYARLCATNHADRQRSVTSNAPAESAALRPAVAAVVQFANYYSTRERFKALNRQLAGAAAVVVVGVLVFGYTSNPSAPANSSTPPHTGAPVAPPTNSVDIPPLLPNR